MTAGRFDDKQAPVLHSFLKTDEKFKERISSERMRSKRNPVDYRDKEMELQLVYVSAYIQTLIIPKNLHASFLFHYCVRKAPFEALSVP